MSVHVTLLCFKRIKKKQFVDLVTTFFLISLTRYEQANRLANTHKSSLKKHRCGCCFTEHITYSRPDWLWLMLTSSPLLLSPFPPSRLPVSRGDLCVQHPRAGSSIWGSGAERYIWRGPTEGPWPGGLRAAEGIHLHHSGSRLRFRSWGRGGEKVPQVSKTDSSNNRGFWSLTTFSWKRTEF